MPNRYKNNRIIENNLKLYEKARKKRGIPGSLSQYKMRRTRRPTAEEIATIEPIGHIWTTGDRLYKLAEKYYNDPTLWWVIAWYNNRPTEGHFKVGDVIQIPTPIERVYGLMRM